MGPIRFSGMASGLPPNIVEQLVEVERIPIKNLEVNKGKTDSKLKLVNDLETKISDVQKTLGEMVGTRGFQNHKLISGDANIINGVVDPEAVVPGTWSLEVMQLAQKPGIITNGFPDKDRTEVGVGYFKFKTPSGTKEVYISGNTTLEGVVKQINGANVGVRASLVNDRSDRDNPWRLVIAGLATGDDNEIEFPSVYLLDGDQDLNFEQSRKAQNGKIKVDGFEIEIPDNTVEDLIPGVTLELKQAAPGREIALTIKEDYEVISGKAKEFVDAMNGVLQFIQAQNQMNEKTDTTKTLGGDSLLRQIENRFRSLLQNPVMGVQGPINRLSQLGIEFQRNGTLKLDQDKFNSILAKAPKDVQAFLAGDGFNLGFVPAVRREVGTMLNQAFGPLANRKRGLQQKIDQINRSIDNKERALVRKEESLRNKFAKLEETMSRLKSQGGAVAAIGASVQGLGGVQGQG